MKLFCSLRLTLGGLASICCALVNKSGREEVDDLLTLNASLFFFLASTSVIRSGISSTKNVLYTSVANSERYVTASMFTSHSSRMFIKPNVSNFNFCQVQDRSMNINRKTKIFSVISREKKVAIDNYLYFVLKFDYDLKRFENKIANILTATKNTTGFK